MRYPTELIRQLGELDDARAVSDVSLSKKSTYYNSLTIILMKEEGRKKDTGKMIGKYQIRPRLDSDVAKAIQINDYIYYFNFCEGQKGKQKKPYDIGYFAAVHHITTGNLTIFFKRSKKLVDLQAIDSHFIDQKGFDFTKLRQVENKFVIEYQMEGNTYDLQVKLDTVQIANQWKQFIYACKPELGQPSKIKKKSLERKQEKDKMASTKDSKDSRQEEVVGLCRIYSQKIANNKMMSDKCQQIGQDKGLRLLRLKIIDLQDLLSAERCSKQAYIKENQDYRRESQLKIERLQAKLRLSDKQLKQLIIEQNSGAQSAKQGGRQRQQLKQTVSILTSQYKQSQVDLKNIELKLKENKQKIEEMSRQLNQLKSSLEQANQKVEQANRRADQASRRVEQANQRADKYKIKLDEITKANQQLISTNASLNQSIKDSELKISNIQELGNRSLQFQRLTCEYKGLYTSLKESFEVRCQQLTRKYEQSLQQSKQAKAACEQKAKQVKILIFNSLFNGEMLQNLGGYKEFLVNEIESYMNRTIVKTKLVYRFDPFNKVNFHNYIDNCSNLAIIVRTTTGYYLAGFTESAFYPKMNASDAGLLLSLTNCKTFRCQEGKKAITYDEYYIIFGNSQLRIKSLENRVFSNFGINNGFYNSNGCKVDILLGDSSREVDIDAYEIYQVHFD